MADGTYTDWLMSEAFRDAVTWTNSLLGVGYDGHLSLLLLRVCNTRHEVLCEPLVFLACTQVEKVLIHYSDPAGLS